MQAIRTVQRSRPVWAGTRHFAVGNFVPADMPIVKQKWKSVDIVGKITTTMRNVAAGKLPGSEKFLRLTRPFASVTAPFYELTEVPPGVKKHLHLVVGCERGLCGRVGANLPKIVTNTVRKAVQERMINGGDHEIEVVVLGKKTATKLKASLPDQTTEGYIAMKTKLPTMAMCLDLTDRILSSREFDRMTIHYNVFKNTSKFWPSVIEIYSLDICKQAAGLQFLTYEVESDEITVLQNLQEFKIASTLYNCMAEQLASEMGSRLASMDTASKSCRDKSKEYEQVYQRLRKTKITNELTVLSVGAKLSKSK